jgi:L-ribulokinase
MTPPRIGRRAVIGVDFGTLSGRAVVVSVDDGTTLGSAVHEYTLGVLTETLPGSGRRRQDWTPSAPRCTTTSAGTGAT